MQPCSAGTAILWGTTAQTVQKNTVQKKTPNSHFLLNIENSHSQWLGCLDGAFKKTYASLTDAMILYLLTLL